MIETWSGALPNLESIDIDEIILQTLRYLPLDKVGGCFFDREYLAYAILKPNLYCVLLLESMGQMSHSTNLITLTDFVKNESNKLKAETADYINYSEFSRALSGEFPSVLKELFLIEEKRAINHTKLKHSIRICFLPCCIPGAICPFWTRDEPRIHLNVTLNFIGNVYI